MSPFANGTSANGKHHDVKATIPKAKNGTKDSVDLEPHLTSADVIRLEHGAARAQVSISSLGFRRYKSFFHKILCASCTVSAQRGLPGSWFVVEVSRLLVGGSTSDQFARFKLNA
jgi:hypothetical protein